MMASHSSLSEVLMLQPRVLAALLAYLEGRNASQDQIRRYIRYWRTSPRDPSVPCPNCYTFRGKHSGLTALQEKDPARMGPNTRSRGDDAAGVFDNWAIAKTIPSDRWDP